jgi:hypothetical protein
MGDYLVHVSASINCSHGGSATIMPSQQRVKVAGNFVAVLADTTTVAGCSFQVPIGTGTKPQPCVKIQWAVPATRVKVNQQFALIKTSSGVCQSAEQIPQGPPTIASTQVKVKAT